MTTRYTVTTLRSGQPRAYADSEHEYLITIEPVPYWLTQKNEPKARQVVKAIARDFGSEGLEGMAAMMAAKLDSLVIDPKAGTIRAVIREPYNE